MLSFWDECSWRASSRDSKCIAIPPTTYSHMQPWSSMHTCQQMRKVDFWCQLTVPTVSDARSWGSLSRWNKSIKISSWLLLQAGQVVKMPVKDPILVRVLKATLKRWPTEKELLEFKAFLIHKRELFALLGKSHCYSWRRLLSHVNYIMYSMGRNRVHENVIHEFWLLACKLCQHKPPVN